MIRLRSGVLPVLLAAAATAGDWSPSEVEARALSLAEGNDAHAAAAKAMLGKPGTESFERFARIFRSSLELARRREASREVIAAFLDHPSPAVRLDAAVFLADEFQAHDGALALERALREEKGIPRARAMETLLALLDGRRRADPGTWPPPAFWRRLEGDPSLAWTFREPPPFPAGRPPHLRREPPPPFAKRQELDRLVQRLGADAMEARDEAAKGILALGAEHPEGVLAALPKDHDDPEVAGRLAELRPQIPLAAARARAVSRLEGKKQLLDSFDKLWWGYEGGDLRALGWALKETDPQLAADVLAAFFSHRDPDVAAAAAEMIGAVGAKEAAGALEELLLDTPHPQIRWRAIGALEKLEAREARGSVARFLSDPDVDVRRAAATFLMRWGGRDEAPRLAKALADPEERVRLAASEALWRTWARSTLSRPLADMMEGETNVSFSRAAGEALLLVHGLERRGIDPKAWWRAHRDDPDFR